MMDLATLQYVNRKATRAAAKRQAVPCIWSDTTDGFRLQFVGDRCPRGWKNQAVMTCLLITAAGAHRAS